ncbi:MAG: hypothetical protein WCC39_13995, partial [Telluria sp.]
MEYQQFNIQLPSLSEIVLTQHLRPSDDSFQQLSAVNLSHSHAPMSSHLLRRLSIKTKLMLSMAA